MGREVHVKDTMPLLHVPSLTHSGYEGKPQTEGGAGIQE